MYLSSNLILTIRNHFMLKGQLQGKTAMLPIFALLLMRGEHH